MHIKRCLCAIKVKRILADQRLTPTKQTHLVKCVTTRVSLFIVRLTSNWSESSSYWRRRHICVPWPQLSTCSWKLSLKSVIIADKLVPECWVVDLLSKLTVKVQWVKGRRESSLRANFFSRWKDDVKLMKVILSQVKCQANATLSACWRRAVNVLSSIKALLSQRTETHHRLDQRLYSEILYADLN